MCKNVKLFLLLILLLPIPKPDFAVISPNDYYFISESEKENQIKGRVIDAETRMPIEYASIKLFDQKDTLQWHESISDKHGNFSINEILPGDYLITVSYIGFGIDQNWSIHIEEKGQTVDLGVIPLKPEIQEIGDVVVSGRTGNTAVKIDKTVIRVDNMPQGEGGTAVDVLRNLPSISQTPSGQISIHGNTNFLVLVNGKPTSLKGNEMLQYFPANEIFKVELISNPTAKYDASGTGGIINIITKNTINTGLSGNANISADQLGGYSSDLLFNLKGKKISLFTGIDHNRRKTKGEIERWTNEFINDQEEHFSQEGEQQAERNNTGIRAGIDYTPSENDKISIAGNIGDYQITNRGDWDSWFSGQDTEETEKNRVTDRNNRNGTYGGAYLALDHQFNNPDNSLSLSGTWTFNNYDDAYRNNIDRTGGIMIMDQSTILEKDFDSFQINADYIGPIGESGKLEAGYQMTFDQQDENYSYQHQHEETTLLDRGTSHFDRYLHAFYAVLGKENDKFEWQIGLRSEFYNRQLNKNTGETYKKDHWDFYPSFHTGWKLDSVQRLLFSYSRRTRKLEAAQLDPLPRWYDFYQVKTGNPLLNNEMSDRLSLSYNRQKKNLSLNSELYFSRITDKIENFRTLYGIDNIIQNTNENVGSEYLTGLEINVEYAVTPWWSIAEKTELFASRLKIDPKFGTEERRYNQITSFTTNRFKISPNTQIELELSYYSPSKNSQIEIGSFFMTGLNFRQQFFNNKLSLTVTGNDILNLYKSDERIKGQEFDQRIITRAIYPIRFSISYKINNFKKEENRINKLPPNE